MGYSGAAPLATNASAPVIAVAPQAVSASTIPVNSKSDAREKLTWVAKVVHQARRLLKVEDLGEYYYQEQGEMVYHSLSDNKIMEWVRDAWLDSIGLFTPKEIDDGVKMVKLMTTDKVASINSDNIMICPGLYWVKKRGELTGEPTGATFYQLFDTDYPDRHTVRVAPFTEDQRQRLLDRYSVVKDELARGIFNCPYEFINVWANNDPDVAQDILKMIAACFLDKKPLGSGVLVGLKRNGKSTFVDMLHTMFGNRNTSRVQLTQLGDPHYNHALRFTLMNAPDEEEDKAVEYSGLFKTMADHGVLSLQVMRSNHALRVPCDFMSFFPMNHTPEWKGTGASACVARSLIIPFENDLSKYDKASKNFCEETFTADMFCELLGTVFAYAWYYSRHELNFSKRMSLEQNVIQEDLDSTVIYKKEFEDFFDGFENIKTLYADYQCWCMARETRISKLQQFKFVFKPYLSRRTKAYRNGNRASVYRIKQDGVAAKQQLFSDSYFPEFGYLDTLHGNNVSVVERLQDKYKDTLNDMKEYEQYELGKADSEE